MAKTKPQKKIKLVPPDPKQCQRNHLEGCHPDAQHFMILGPGKIVRCTKEAWCIVYETKPGADGQKGSMSLCRDCYMEFSKQPGFTTFRMEQIVKPKTKTKRVTHR